MFIDDVTDANSRSNFEEVGRETVVKSGWTLVLQDRPKQSTHSCLGAVDRHYNTHNLAYPVKKLKIKRKFFEKKTNNTEFF